VDSPCYQFLSRTGFTHHHEGDIRAGHPHTLLDDLQKGPAVPNQARTAQHFLHRRHLSRRSGLGRGWQNAPNPWQYFDIPERTTDKIIQTCT
jgi:hypothetical protein